MGARCVTGIDISASPESAHFLCTQQGVNGVGPGTSQLWFRIPAPPLSGGVISGKRLTGASVSSSTTWGMILVPLLWGHLTD